MFCGLLTDVQSLSIELKLNPLTAELNPIRHLLAVEGARHIVHVSRIRVLKWFLISLRHPLYSGFISVLNILFLSIVSLYVNLISSSVHTVTTLMAGQSKTHASIPERVKTFFASKNVHRPLGPNRYPIQWIPGFLSSRSTVPNITLPTHLHVMIGLRMYGDIPPLPHNTLWHIKTLPLHLIRLLFWGKSVFYD